MTGPARCSSTRVTQGGWVIILLVTTPAFVMVCQLTRCEQAINKSHLFMPIVPAIVGSLVLEPGPALPGQTCPNQYLLLVLCCLLHGSPPHSSCSTPPTKAELAGAGYGADGPEVLTGAGPTQMQLVGESSLAHKDIDQPAEATSTTCAVLLSMQGSVWLLCPYTRWCALHFQHTHIATNA